MPDLKTELTTKVLPVIDNLNNIKFDDSDDPVPMQSDAPTTITRKIFDDLVAHGPCVVPEIHKRTGIPSAGIYPRLAGLIDRGLVRKLPDGSYDNVGTEFKTLSRGECVARMNAARAEKKGKPKAVAKPTPKVAPKVAAPDALGSFVDALTVADARRLRDKLNAMFN
jgi:hypothetical protein